MYSKGVNGIDVRAWEEKYPEKVTFSSNKTKHRTQTNIWKRRLFQTSEIESVSLKAELAEEPLVLAELVSLLQLVLDLLARLLP